MMAFFKVSIARVVATTVALATMSRSIANRASSTFLTSFSCSARRRRRGLVGHRDSAAEPGQLFVDRREVETTVRTPLLGLVPANASSVASRS